MIDITIHARRASGFTLIEVMVVVAILGILAAIAIPNYTAYLQRSRIIDATSRLGDFRIRMEQYFLDNRTYLANGGGGCGIPDPVLPASAPFDVRCRAADARNYTVTATGQAGANMTGFTYTIDQNGIKTSNIASWGASSQQCWIIRKDGTCI